QKDPTTKIMNRSFLCGWIGTMLIAAKLAATEVEHAGGGPGPAITVFCLGGLIGVFMGILLVITVGGLISPSHDSVEAIEHGMPAGATEADPFDVTGDRMPALPGPDTSAGTSEAVQKPPDDIRSGETA